MIIVFIIFIAMALMQIPALIRKKYWKELFAFSVFFTAAFVLSLLYVLDVNIPSPMKGVQYIVEDIMNIKY